MKKALAPNIANGCGTASGILSFLGGYQVCHNVCIGIVTLLSAFGIVIAGMPLFFLTKLALPFWLAAVGLLAIGLFFYAKGLAISKALLLLNSGIIVAGTPFQLPKPVSLFFWAIGGAIVLAAVVLMAKARLRGI
ncbi:MAG: hypothetical protein QXU88_00140 [Candidatus Woesearchaeota archaeon]